MKDFYLLIGSESALADRALAKLNSALRQENAEFSNLAAGEVAPGDIADALSPSLFSERRAVIIRDLQDLPEDSKARAAMLRQAPLERLNDPLLIPFV